MNPQDDVSKAATVALPAAVTATAVPALTTDAKVYPSIARSNSDPPALEAPTGMPSRTLSGGDHGTKTKTKVDPLNVPQAPASNVPTPPPAAANIPKPPPTPPPFFAPSSGIANKGAIPMPPSAAKVPPPPPAKTYDFSLLQHTIYVSKSHSVNYTKERIAKAVKEYLGKVIDEESGLVPMDKDYINVDNIRIWRYESNAWASTPA